MTIDLSDIDPTDPYYEPTVINFMGGEAIVSFNSADISNFGKVDLDVSFDANTAEDSWIHVKDVDQFSEVKDVNSPRYHLIKLRNCKLRFNVTQSTVGDDVRVIIT